MSKYTNITPLVTQLIENGETIKVSKILVSHIGPGSALASIYEADGTTLITNIQCRTGRDMTSFELSTGFIAKNGISITTGANTSCLICYSSGGA